MHKIPPPAIIINRSGYEIGRPKCIEPLRKGYFRVKSESVGGDAPKDLVAIYEYGQGRRITPKNWPRHIAKVGQKYYPNESITEQLMTRIGQILGIEVADSKLLFFGHQLRFLSRNFLKPNENLVHGAQIFAGYLNDEKFVHHVEEENEARHIFTFQFVEEAFLNLFPEDHEELLMKFTKLLAFDCIVGNNDRHFYNWGVIRNLSKNHKPVFSPIYDTARGLFWNLTEENLQKHAANKIQRQQFIEKYVRSSLPKTGWDGLQSPNHFTLIEKIATERYNLSEALNSLRIDALLAETESVLHEEMHGLFSRLRKELILECLAHRIKLYCHSAGILL